jgi:hypothetical protein
MRQVKDLHEDETCQSRCMLEPLCAVWQLRNATEQGGNYTCWHGIAGEGCRETTEPKPVVAQRLQHGNFRVLMNLAGMQLANLWRVFDASFFANWEDGARECRLVCISFLLCQYWQYNDGLGCFIEYPLQGGQYVVPYPLVKDNIMLSSSGTAMQHIRAGEFIQHYCRETDGVPLPLPTDAPVVFQAPHPLRKTTSSTTSTTAAARDTTAAPTAMSSPLSQVRVLVHETTVPAATASAAPGPPADRSLHLPSWQYTMQPSTTLASAAVPPEPPALASAVRVTDAKATITSQDTPNLGQWVALGVISVIVGAGLIGVWIWVLSDSSRGGVRKPYMYSSPNHEDFAGQPGQQSFNVMMPGPYQPQMQGAPPAAMGGRGPMGGYYNCLPQGGMGGAVPPPYAAPPTMPSMGPGGPYGQMPLY